MKKNGLITILILFPLILTSCGLKQNTSQANTSEFQNINKESITDLENDNHYELLTETFDYKDMKIKFPQVAMMLSSVKQKKINELIKKEVYSFVDMYRSKDGFDSDIVYTIKLKTSEFLSIQFSGDMYEIGDYGGDFERVKEIYTINIDLSNGEKVRLKDLVSIDENLVEKLQGVIDTKFEYKVYTTQELIKMLEEADSNSNSSEIYSYLTKNSIGVICRDVDFTLGEHADLEIKYEDIKNNFLGDYYIRIQEMDSSK